MDVKSVFLHGDLTKEIDMEQPPCFMTDSSLVCRLKESLYNLKWEPCAWYKKIDWCFFNPRFKHFEPDHDIHGDTLIMALLFNLLKHKILNPE